MKFLKWLVKMFTPETIKSIDRMSRIRALLDKLKTNCKDIDNIFEESQKLEAEGNDPEALEDLYQREFMLFMEHIGIFEDLMKSIDREPKTIENEFELARIEKQAQEICRVKYVEI